MVPQRDRRDHCRRQNDEDNSCDGENPPTTAESCLLEEDLDLAAGFLSRRRPGKGHQCGRAVPSIELL
jgi:hypothetical protein